MNMPVALLFITCFEVYRHIVDLRETKKIQSQNNHIVAQNILEASAS